MASRTGSPALHTSRKQQPSTAGASSARSSPKPAGTPPPPAAAAAASNAPQQPLPDLDQLLNLPIRVKVAAAGPGVAARDVEGSLFAVDSSFIVLAAAPAGSSAGAPAGAAAAAAAGAAGATAPKRTFHFLKTSTLESVTVLLRTADPSLPAPSTPLSFAHLPRTPADVSHAVSRALAAQARLAPAGVSADAQKLFDALARTLPVRWAGESIVVLDEVVVDKPYGIASVKGAKGSAERVERVRKMLEGIRNRLGLTTPQPAA
ncbi:uncharacterized protein RHOBADRAFT_51112 [Rhodotorula graminis WP1]|uniref:AD domain-containing protein n=1 Tax=Rhodotorula graminis (strain WP1) TaxID=578459 RepID=A0A194SDH2_RHOGW|nr:uncharacterized protein RHOBADRAFT_51112 [Rhodotorula graminis WP1]KPV78674.1 hypothetical protein RHOBADRAFT_51112 [Rhodotorula graminis WP1]